MKQSVLALWLRKRLLDPVSQIITGLFFGPYASSLTCFSPDVSRACRVSRGELPFAAFDWLEPDDVRLAPVYIETYCDTVLTYEPALGAMRPACDDLTNPPNSAGSLPNELTLVERSIHPIESCEECVIEPVLVEDHFLVIMGGPFTLPPGRGVSGSQS